MWAREYATHDELRDLVDEFEPGRSAPFDADHSLHGFMNGDRRQERRPRSP